MHGIVYETFSFAVSKWSDPYGDYRMTKYEPPQDVKTSTGGETWVCELSHVAIHTWKYEKEQRFRHRVKEHCDLGKLCHLQSRGAKIQQNGSHARVMIA